MTFGDRDTFRLHPSVRASIYLSISYLLSIFHIPNTGFDSRSGRRLKRENADSTPRKMGKVSDKGESFSRTNSQINLKLQAIRNAGKKWIKWLERLRT